MIVPPNIPDEPMQHAQKRLPNAPLSWPPASKAKTMPATQMPPRASTPSNHLGGEVVAKIPSQVASSQPKLPKDDELPNIPDSDDDHDPNAAPSGHQQPLLPYENAESDPLNIPAPQEEQAQESEREDTDETIPYNDDSDDTQDYSDLFVDELTGVISHRSRSYAATLLPSPFLATLTVQQFLLVRSSHPAFMECPIL